MEMPSEKRENRLIAKISLGDKAVKKYPGIFHRMNVAR